MGANEYQSVAYAATLLQGAARVWWDSYLADHLDMRPKKLDEFLNVLQQRFLSPMYEKEARMKLWGITQRKDKSVHAFASRF